MSSLRQIQANRLNARLSTGPVTEDGKKRSRQNALRHGLTAETVIAALEDAEDYAAFQMAVTADYDPQSAVERELVLRLASVLWRLRRATTIETGLFEAQARHVLLFQERRPTRRTRHELDDTGAQADEVQPERDQECLHDDRPDLPRRVHLDPSDGLTRSFVNLNNLPTYPLDRLSRYETTLWRQTCQILFTLQCLNRPQSWRRRRGIAIG